MSNNIQKKSWYNKPEVIIPLAIGLFLSIAFFIYQLDAKYWIKQNDYIIILFWFLFSSFITYLLVGRHISFIPVKTQNSKSRIVVLLPISAEGYYNDDLQLIASGLGDGLRDFVKKINSELSEQYEIVFIDNYNYNSAIPHIKKELRLGTRYFVSTISKFSIRFSKEFEGLANGANNQSAILINTISGSTEIKTKINKVYNFYPTSEMEISALLDYTKTNTKLVKPYIYTFNSVFTKECRRILIKKWNEVYSIENKITQNKNSIEFTDIYDNDDRLHPNFYSAKVKSADSIFIFAYGKAFFDIIENLKLKIDLKDKTIFTLSTFRFKNWVEKEKTILDDLKIITVRPEMVEMEFKTDVDVVKYFSEQTLDRLLNTLEKINSDPNTDFDTAWLQSKPSLLKINGDNTISVKTLPVNLFL